MPDFPGLHGVHPEAQRDLSNAVNEMKDRNTKRAAMRLRKARKTRRK